MVATSNLVPLCKTTSIEQFHKWFILANSILNFSDVWPASKDTILHEQILPVFKRISLVHSIFRVSNFSILFPFTKLVSVVLCIFILLGCISLRGKLHPLAYLVLPNCTIILLCEIICASSLMSKLHTYSSQLQLNSSHMQIGTNASTMTMTFQKSIRSCNPIRFEVARLYFVDRGIMLTLSGIIIQNTITLLLAR